MDVCAIDEGQRPFDRENTGVMAYKIMPGSRLSLTYMDNLRMVKYESHGVARSTS